MPRPDRPSPGRRPRLAGLLGLALVSLTARPLRAETLLGGQVTVAEPQGDWNGGNYLHGNTGAGAGLHWLFAQFGNHAFRLRGDGTWLPRGPININTDDGSYHLLTESAKVRALDAAAEYNLFPTNTNLEGFYFIFGLGYSWCRFYQARLIPGGIGDPTQPFPSSHRARAMLYDLGAGARVSQHLGWEMRYTQANLRDVGVSSTVVKTPTFDFSLTFDF